MSDSPSKSLEFLIRERDFESVHFEFNRALSNINSSPKDAILSASNILESLFKIYIEEEKIEMPSKQDLQSVWNVVRKSMDFDQKKIVDRDVNEILSGIFAIVNGIGALRTHASSAHGTGKKAYKIEPRHARLAVNGAHSLASFIIETWDKRKKL